MLTEVNRLVSGTYRAPLSNLIAQNYNQLMLLLSAIDCSERAVKQYDWTDGMACLSDIVAYHIGWGKLLISWYDAGIRGSKIIMPGEGFSKWDYVGLAHHFYKKYAYDSYHEQENVFLCTVKRIIEITEDEYKAHNLDKLNVWSWCTLPSGKPWPLAKWIQVNTVSPYKRSICVIKKARD